MSITDRDISRVNEISARLFNPLGGSEVIALCEWIAGVPVDARTQPIRSEIEIQLTREVDSKCAKDMISKITDVLRMGKWTPEEHSKIAGQISDLQKQTDVAANHKRLRMADKRDFMKPRAVCAGRLAGGAFLGEERWAVRDKRKEKIEYVPVYKDGVYSHTQAGNCEDGIASGVAGLQQLAENCCPRGFDSPDKAILAKNEKQFEIALANDELNKRLNKANRKRGRKHKF
jgi:hypothetical protein